MLSEGLRICIRSPSHSSPAVSELPVEALCVDAAASLRVAVALLPADISDTRLPYRPFQTAFAGNSGASLRS